MAKKTRSHVDDLRGVGKLAVEATKSVTDLVQSMHTTIASGPAILGSPLEGPVRLFTAPVYGTIRAVTKLVGSGIDYALSQLAPLLGESVPGPEREAVLAALNGVLGDYLHDTGNPLAIQMRFRHNGGQPLILERDELRKELPQASTKVLVLVHGSSMNDLQWNRNGHDHGAALARDLGYTPVYLHYNTGLHISTNGKAFAELLEKLIAAWPVRVNELVLLGHSMGGLVARSACHAGEVASHAWRKSLRQLICLGTPHHGSPLERGGSWAHLLIGVSRYSAPLGRLAKIRSAGVTDLRFGNVLDEHWEGRDRFAVGKDPRRALKLPANVDCYAIAATTAPAPTESTKAKTKLPGDGLVPVDSALGRHEKPELTLKFPKSNQWIGYGMNHLDLLDNPEVYSQIGAWLDDITTYELI
jgi:pimeloyl-ACP methyl ester carboxylesterase